MKTLRHLMLLACAAGAPVVAWGQTYFFTIHADGASQVPPQATAAIGEGLATLDWSTLTFSLDFETSGLSSPQTAANIHLGAIGKTGPVVIALPNGSLAGFSTKIDSVSAAELIAGRAYLSVSSRKHPDGEIRGQLGVSTGLVPEPSAFGLIGGAIGLAAWAFHRERRRRRSSADLGLRTAARAAPVRRAADQHFRSSRG